MCCLQLAVKCICIYETGKGRWIGGDTFQCIQRCHHLFTTHGHDYGIEHWFKLFVWSQSMKMCRASIHLDREKQIESKVPCSRTQHTAHRGCKTDVNEIECMCRHVSTSHSFCKCDNFRSLYLIKEIKKWKRKYKYLKISDILNLILLFQMDQWWITWRSWHHQL